jgi:hypothetical protein
MPHHSRTGSIEKSFLAVASLGGVALIVAMAYAYLFMHQ